MEKREFGKTRPMDIVDVLTDRLKKLMVEHHVKAAPLARAADLNESAVRDILRGRSKNPGIVTLQKIASVLNLRPSALFEAGAKWPIVGKVSDGGVVSRFSENDNEEYAVENPFFISLPANLAAISVVDNSLAPFAFEGDALVFSDRGDIVGEINVSRPAICALEDGRSLVRLPRPTDAPDRFNLLPVNPYASPEMDQRIKSHHTILFSLPSWVTAPGPTPTHAAPTTVQENQSPFRGKGE